MALKIVRNDITRMNTDVIVNTANPMPTVGAGCDFAIYTAAGFDELLEYREKTIGEKQYGDVFVTPGFNLPQKHIIHAVSPAFRGGEQGEEILLRKCYKESLAKAAELEVKSIAFPLISTGSFGYPKEEGLRIAVDEISAFLLNHDMLVYIVVYDEVSTKLGKSLFDDLDSYIDQHYIEMQPQYSYEKAQNSIRIPRTIMPRLRRKKAGLSSEESDYSTIMPSAAPMAYESVAKLDDDDYFEIDRAIYERMKHLSDTFSEYFVYLVESKGMTHKDVYKRALIDKKAYSKIKNNPHAHPKKFTAMCLCMGAMLNIDETIDLLARAGYALSPCDKTDIIFRYFIEKEIYDMTELDIQLEEHGLPCIIQ